MPLLTSKFNAKFSSRDLNQLFDLNIKESFEFSLSTDSRTITKSDLFIPLRGEKFDGHEFINDVLDKGIRYSFCEKTSLDKVSGRNKHKLIVVDKTIDAYNKIANYYRNRLNAKVITITGSSGKTTVKELIACVLSEKFKVHKTEANFNNEIGVPKTILEAPQDTEVLVLELAMRRKGEIDYLSKTAEPDIAIITNVGLAHIGRLGDLSSIIEAKCEIFNHMKKEGLGFLHKNDSLIEYFKKEKIEKVKDCIVFDISEVGTDYVFKDGKSFFSLGGDKYFIYAKGKTHILNSVLAIKLAKHKLFNLTKEELQRGLSKFAIPRGRGNIIALSRDFYIVDESYNASPDTVKLAVGNLLDSWGNLKKVLVIGELAELGGHKDKLLRDLMDWIGRQKLDSIVGIGEDYKEYKSKNMICADNINEANKLLRGIVENGKTVVLVKASRVAGLEKIVSYLEKLGK